jgi:small GTP-binding protein
MPSVYTDKKETVISDQLSISETREDFQRNISSFIDQSAISSIFQNSSLFTAKMLELNTRRFGVFRNHRETAAFATMPAKRCKLIFAGESGVGKTCIINRAVTNVFTHVDSTIAGQFSRLERTNSRGENIAFDIWDTAGQEKFRCLTKNFFQGAKAAVLVFDLTTEDTLPAIKFFADQIRTVSGNETLIVLAGNKSDLVSLRKITGEKGEHIADEVNAKHYFECSAMSGEGISAIFEYLADNITEFINPKHGTEEPPPPLVLALDKPTKQSKKKRC